MSPVMSHHLTKLHKKALAAGTTSSLAQVKTNVPLLELVTGSISLCLNFYLIIWSNIPLFHKYCVKYSKWFSFAESISNVCGW